MTNLLPGDFNGDGKTDFLRQEKGAWANDAINTAGIYFSNGDGSFNEVRLSESFHLNGNLTNLLPGSLLYTDNFVSTPSGYHSELASLNPGQWDRYSGESAQYGKYGNFTEGDSVQEDMPSNVLAVYEDLSMSVFGSVKSVNAGYAFDTSYLQEGVGYHAGIDVGAANGTVIKAATNGIVARVYTADYGGVVGIDETNSRGEKTGRRWWYVHMSANLVAVGAAITAGQTELGRVGRRHLHLAITSSSRNLDPANGSSATDVTNRTMSPLDAFWRSKNNIDGY